MSETLNLEEISSIEGQSKTFDSVIGENYLRVYPYRLLNTSKQERKFIQVNTTSVISISNDKKHFDNKQTHTITDESGHQYFKVATSIDKRGMVLNINNTSVTGDKYSSMEDFTVITNQWNNSNSDHDYIFFIGRPYNEKDFNDGLQQAFIPGIISFASQTIENYHQNHPLANDENIFIEMPLNDIRTIANGYPNSDIIFLEYDVNDLDITIDKNGAKVPGYTIDMENHTLLHSIKTKIKTGDKTKNIDLTLKDGLTPFKMTPIDNQDNITMFADWFDYDMVMPLYLANILVTPKTLNSLVNTVIPGTTNKIFGQPEVDLISDAIMFSYGYATRWKDLPTYTVTEAEALKSVKPGDIKGDTLVGNTGIKIQKLIGKQPLQEIDLLFEAYIREHPEKENSIELKAIKQLTAALSRYIYSSYAIGRGQNSFNKIYLPWYLKPVTAIKLTHTGQHFKLDTTIEFKFESEWFEFKNGKVSVKPNLNISDVRMIQTDRKLTVPSVPDRLNGLSKIPLAGDISTTTSRDLMYMWYLPIGTEDEFNKLFLSKGEEIISTDEIRTTTTDWKRAYIDYRKIYSPSEEAKREAEQYLTNKYGVGNYAISSNGVLEFKTDNVELVETISSTKKYHILNDGTNTSYPAWGNTLLPYFSKLPTNIDTISYNNLQTDEQRAAWNYIVAYIFGNSDITALGEIAPEDMSKITIKTATADIGLPAGKYHYFEHQYRLVGLKYKLTVPVKEVNINRDTLFDKDKWKDFINHYLNLKGTTNKVSLYSEFNEGLNGISEITIASLWADTFTITLGNRQIKVKTINEYDETVAIQRILIT